jgi:hypothetical protein
MKPNGVPKAGFVSTREGCVRAANAENERNSEFMVMSRAEEGVSVSGKPILVNSSVGLALADTFFLSENSVRTLFFWYGVFSFTTTNKKMSTEQRKRRFWRFYQGLFAR